MNVATPSPSPPSSASPSPAVASSDEPTAAKLSAVRDRLIFALDVAEPAAALELARSLRSELRWIKVGSTLFTRGGSALIGELIGMGYSVFLDLKFHDIPAQVEGACAAAARLGVSLLTVHASGGATMLQAAARGARAGAAAIAGSPPKVLAVTVLTSLDEDDLRTAGVGRSAADQVVALAQLAETSGCDGVVASPQELPMLRAALSPGFGILTPGIRPVGSSSDDQKRTLTPADAVRGGATWLVVGRPIRNADDPAAAAAAILREMAAASEEPSSR